MQLPFVTPEIFESPVFTLCTIRFNIVSFYTACSYVSFRSWNMQHYLYGFCNRQRICLRCGTKWNSSVSFFIFKGLNRLHLHLQPYTDKPLLLQCDPIFCPSLVYINTWNEFFGYGWPQTSKRLISSSSFSSTTLCEFWFAQLLVICFGQLNTNTVNFV